MDQKLALKARCWKCGDTFHFIVTPADQDQKSGLVLKVLPCPYCQTECQVTVRAEQVTTGVVFRGPGEAPRTWAQASERERSRTVHETTPPDAAGRQAQASQSNPNQP